MVQYDNIRAYNNNQPYKIQYAEFSGNNQQPSSESGQKDVNLMELLSVQKEEEFVKQLQEHISTKSYVDFFFQIQQNQFPEDKRERILRIIDRFNSKSSYNQEELRRFSDTQ